VNALLGALAFGSLVYLVTAACARFTPRRENAGRLGSEFLRVGLCSAAAFAGGALLAHDAAPAAIFAIAILCAALGATCYLAALDAPVPAAIPGAALVILIGAALFRSDAGPLASAIATGAPFAATAFFAPRSGADWHDAVVAALGGAAFGLPFGLVAATFACLAFLFARPYLARHRTTPQPRPRFASALAATFLVALIGQLVIS
jgi:hypothetical protein